MSAVNTWGAVNSWDSGSALEILPSVINSASVALNPVIQLVGRLEIIGNVLNSSSLSNAPTVVPSFGLDVLEQSVNSSSTSNNPDIVVGEVVISVYFSTNIDIVDLSRNINV